MSRGADQDRAGRRRARGARPRHHCAQARRLPRRPPRPRPAPSLPSPRAMAGPCRRIVSSAPSPSRISLLTVLDVHGGDVLKASSGSACGGGGALGCFIASSSPPASAPRRDAQSVRTPPLLRRAHGPASTKKRVPCIPTREGITVGLSVTGNSHYTYLHPDEPDVIDVIGIHRGFSKTQV